MTDTSDRHLPGYGPPQNYGLAQGYGQQPEFAPPDYRLAARPGIIPLRPLAVGEILTGAFGYIRANLAATLGLAFVVFTMSWLVQLLGQILSPSPRNLSQKLLFAFGIGPTSIGLVSTVFSIVGTAILNALLVVVLSRAVVGRRTGPGQAWAVVAPRILGLIGLSLLITLIVGGAAAVVGPAAGIGALAITFGGGGAWGPLAALVGLAGLSVAIYFGVLLGMAPVAYVLEGIGVTAALSRSRSLVRGAFGRIFGILLLALLLVAVFSAVLLVPLGLATGFYDGATPDMIIWGIGAIVRGTFVAPFLAGVMALLYIDQRIRRERLVVGLARAAADAPDPVR